MLRAPSALDSRIAVEARSCTGARRGWSRAAADARARAGVRLGRRRASLHHGPRDRSAAGRAQAVLQRYRDELVIRVVDPDTWRVVGWDDGPNHFLDFGRPDLGPYPFAALPRDYGAALEKFGIETLKRIGTLPWREAEEVRQPAPRVRGVPARPVYAPNDTVLFAAVASHYMQDAHMPLHASNNYDGQLTGQTGVHARFEGRCSSGTSRG